MLAIFRIYVYPYIYIYIYMYIFLYTDCISLSPCLSKCFAFPWCHFIFWLSYCLMSAWKESFSESPSDRMSRWSRVWLLDCIEMIQTLRENVDELGRSFSHCFTVWHFKVAPARLASSHRCWYLLLFIWSWFGRGSARCHCFEYAVALTKYEAIRTVRTVVAMKVPQVVRFGTKPWSARPSARPFIDTFWHLQALLVASFSTLPSTWNWSNFAVPIVELSDTCDQLTCDLINFALRRLGCTGRMAWLGGIPSVGFDQCVPQTEVVSCNEPPKP